MGTPPSFHQVSEFGEVVGEPWRLADRLLSGKTGSPKLVETVHTFSAGWDGHANVSLGRAAFVQRADIARRVGDDSAAIVVRPVVGSDGLDRDIEARITGGVV